MKACVLNVLVAGALVLGGLTSPLRAGHHEIVGRWNITVNPESGGYPSWLGVAWKDGKHLGRFLGSAGSVGDIGVVKFDKPTIEFDAHGRHWTGKVDGDEIKGVAKHGDGREEKWVAKRAVYDVDITGTWVIPGKAKRSITFTEKNGELAGKMPKGPEVQLVRLDGHSLTVHLVPRKAGKLPRKILATVKGDVLDGMISNPDAKFIAKRQREWGEPVELFNGKDLDNWKPFGDPNNYKWSVRDGIMHCEGGSANIVTKRSDFRDFKLHVEFRVPERGNSGVYLRGRHEVQIADNYGQDPSPGGCGSMYSRIVASTNASKKPGEWQTFDITFIGNYLTVVHNGTTIIDNVEVEGITGGAIDSREQEPGPIYLQGDHSAIDYRKVTLTPTK